MNTNKIIFFLIIFIIVKDEDWFSEINSYDKNDKNNGYGYYPKKSMGDFYLCSERKYRVHYKINDEGRWSKEFCCCQPVGIGKSIDGIAISGGKPYMIAIHDYGESSWLNETTGYNTSDICEEGKGYLGDFDRFIEGVAIDGQEWYRFAYGAYSTNEKNLAFQFIRNFFIYDYIDNDYMRNRGEPSDYNKTIIIIKEKNIDLRLLYPEEIKYNGKIQIQIAGFIVRNTRWGGHIGENFANYLKIKKNLNYEIIRYFIPKIAEKVFHNVDMAFNFYWKEKKIDLDVAIKIRPDHHSYRGGFRLTINLDEKDEYFIKIKDVLKSFLKYSGHLNKNSIKKLSESNNFEKLGELIEEFGNYSSLAEEAILFTILAPLLAYEKMDEPI